MLQKHQFSYNVFPHSFNFGRSFSFISIDSITGFNYQNQTYTVTMQSSSICSDSEISTISQGSFVGQAMREKQSNDAVMNSTFMVENQVEQQQTLTAPLEQQHSITPVQEQQEQHPPPQQQEQQPKHQKQQAPLPPPPPPLQHQQSNQDSEYYNEEELWRMMDGDELDNTGDPTHRPSYLELAGNSGSTPIVSRKPRFQFSSMYIIV